ncbi:MAG: hypothetical protein F6K19_29815 [Cyanothece sp. SIO1E1]|nr:hypothetical protein [Cyanothece sp. SIO1E1]
MSDSKEHQHDCHQQRLKHIKRSIMMGFSLQILGLLLNTLDFLEFLVSPSGLAASLWIILYLFLLQIMGLSLLTSMTLPAMLTIEIHFLLNQLDS